MTCGQSEPGLSVLVSLPAHPTATVAAVVGLPIDVDTTNRRSDWGMSGARKYLRLLIDTGRVVWAARRHDALVCVTVGIEAFAAATLRPLLAPRAALVIVDPILPRDAMPVRVWGRSLRGVDRFVVIRRTDVDVLRRRFGVQPDRVDFVAFPSPTALLQVPTRDGGYIYSAGWAHRDWPTLLSALGDVEWAALLAPGRSLDIDERLEARVRVLDMPSPEHGRRLMADCAVVALAFHETDLPSGPLILLDALALGKPVVTSDVAGSRDYVVDGVTALTVPPGDAEAMAAALRRLQVSTALRRQLGSAARAWSRSRSADEFSARVLGVAQDATRQRRRRRRRGPGPGAGS